MVPVTGAPAACAGRERAVSVTPVPRPSTAAPAAWAEVSAGVKVMPVPGPGVPTFVTVTDSVVPAVSIRIVSPAAIPVVDATLMFVSPAAAAANKVVLRDCVPTAAIVAVSSSTFSVPPTTKFATLPSLRLVSPAAAASESVELPYDQRNWSVSL